MHIYTVYLTSKSIQTHLPGIGILWEQCKQSFLKTVQHLKASKYYLHVVMLFWSPLCGQNENASQNVLVCDLHSFIPKGFSVVNGVVWSHHMHLSLSLCPLPSLGDKDGSVVQYWSVVLPWAFPRACSISNGSEVFGCVCVCVSGFTLWTYSHMQFSACKRLQWGVAGLILPFTIRLGVWLLVIHKAQVILEILCECHGSQYIYWLCTVQ